MAVSKVVFNGNTLMDTTDKTVTDASMLSGVTALKNDGTTATGNIATKTSADLSVSGATVTAPAGHYASAASVSVAIGSATTPTTSITANPTISVSSGGLITASVSGSKSVTPTVSVGYVSSGTAGTVSVSGSNTEQLTTQAATTYHPSTTDQTIASGKYLTGAQTVKGVLLTNLSAGNIKKDVVVKVGDSTDDDCVTSVTGTFEGGGGGSSYTLLGSAEFELTTTSTTAVDVGTINCNASDLWTSGKIIYVRTRDNAGKRSGYYYGSDAWFANRYPVTSPSSTSFGSVCRLLYRVNSSGVIEITTTTTGYGVFAVDVQSNGHVSIQARYHSSNTLTISGTFTTEVYSLEWPGNISPFL